jgi:hypothetical protein
MSRLRLEVGHSWDGHALPHDARAMVQVHGLDGGDEVRVDVVSPFVHDPPPFAPPGPVDQLWEHEVVELFVVGHDGSYTELELGPWGHHLLLQLSGVREVVAKLLPVAFEARRAGDRWAGTARVDRALFPAQPVSVNAYRIHGQGAARCYEAHAPVPGAAPDFHRLHCFRAL